MKKHLNPVLALAAGLLGGLVSRYIGLPVAFAQNQAPITKEIRAQRFTLVDSAGRVLGTFVPESTLRLAEGVGGPLPSRILLLDLNGREIWSAGGSPFRTPSER